MIGDLCHEHKVQSQTRSALGYNVWLDHIEFTKIDFLKLVAELSLDKSTLFFSGILSCAILMVPTLAGIVSVEFIQLERIIKKT